MKVSEMVGGKLWGKVVGVLVVVLVMAPESMQLSVDHPLYNTVHRLNANSGPFLGIVFSSPRDEKLLIDSGYFVATPTTPVLIISGRKYKVGKFNGVPAVTVLAGTPLTAVGVSVQILLDTFRIRGIINYGGAATVADDVRVTDVVVPSAVAYTNVWKWKEYIMPLHASNGVAVSELTFAEYNYPKIGANWLGSVDFETVKLYTPTSSKKEIFWFPVDPDWLKIANSIYSTDIEGLGEGRVVHGSKASSSDVYLQNVAYGNFLHENLNVTTVDTESAAVVQTATANGVPSIVFRGVSNKPGLTVDSTLVEVANINVLNVVAEFIRRLSPTPYANILNA